MTGIPSTARAAKLRRLRGILTLAAAILATVGTGVFLHQSPLIQDLLAPGLSLISQGARQVAATGEEVAAVRTAIKENKALRTEIRSYQQQMLLFEELQAENQRLRRLLRVVPPPQYTTVTAAVIGRSPDLWNRQVIIGAGSLHGLAVNTVILSEAGLVGKVIKLSQTNATVQLISDPLSAVSCFNNRSRTFGIVSGRYEQPAKLQFLKLHADIKPEDLLVTSGLGGVFPKGLPIGLVAKVTRRRDQMLPEVDVTLLSDFEHLEEVVALVPKS